jgi:hypothetical protein
LTLRDQGKSFSAVARTLGLRRANDAHAAFLRALRQRSDEDRARIVKREFDRIDELERRIRSRDADQPEKLERRVAALEPHRQALS